jgi:putative ATP-binding cassette transporter
MSDSGNDSGETAGGTRRNHVRHMTGAGPGPLGERRQPLRRLPHRGSANRGGANRGGGQLMSWPDFLRAFLRIAGPYWSSEEKLKVRLLTVALVGLTVLQVAIPVAINRWMRALFDALEAHAMHRFAVLSEVLLVIIVSNVAIVNLHLRVKRRIQIGWRAWLTRRVVKGWMESGRQYQLGYLPGPHDNPDGRIAEDVRNATEYAIDLAHALVYDLLLLISFTQILWSLSQAPYIVIGGTPYYVPGYLVWLAVIYAGVGTVVALALGRPLIRAVDRRQTAEADFRFGLAHARENALGVALARGESDVRRRLKTLFRGVIGAWDGVTRAMNNMFYYSSSWSVLSQVFPTLVVAPRYIAGLITLGGLMQSAQAFQQMVGALSWAIDNLGKVADWRASAERVFGLISAVEGFDDLVRSTGGRRVTVSTGAERVLRFRDFATASPSGAIEVLPFNAEIQEGERVLFTGETGAGSTILKAVGRIWPWGDGEIVLPDGAKLLFMPPRPYLPTGTLRGTIDYPTDGVLDGSQDALLEAVLRKVGLDSLTGRLDESANWDQVLTTEEQQRIGFARLLLKRPDWIFMEEAADTMDAAGQKAMIDLMMAEFPRATVVAIGHGDALAGAETRRFQLERDDGHVTLRSAGRTSSVGGG